MATRQKGDSSQAKETAQKQRTDKPTQQSPVVLTGQAELAMLQRAIADPGRAAPAGILALQRAAGNRAVTRLIQTKLTVGPAGDRYEQEADRVAEQVMSMQPPSPGRRGAGGEVQRQAPEEEEIQTKPLAASITPLVQRQEVPEEEEIQTKPLLQRQAEEEEEQVQTKPLMQRQAEEEEEIQMVPLLQRQAEEEEEVQMQPAVQRQADGSFEAGSKLESRLTAHKGGGSPLPQDVRAYMEPRFGTDFSGVRVHTGGEAVQMNRELNAQAFTHGQDIYLGAGRYDPGTNVGRRLLAHELTHVIQQGGGAVRFQKEELVRTKVVDPPLRVQRHMTYETFLERTPGRRRKKVKPIDNLMKQSRELGNTGTLDKWRTWTDALITACTTYLAYPDKAATRKPGVRELLVQVQEEKGFIDLMCATQGAASPKLKLKELMRLQEVEYQALSDDARAALGNVFHRELGSAADALRGTPAEREMIEEDLDRLQTLAADPRTPSIVRNVIAEILANVPQTHLSFGMPMGALTTPAERARGFTEQYSVVVLGSQSSGAPGRMAELGHELTHVAVSATFGNEPALSIVRTATEDQMRALRDSRYLEVRILEMYSKQDLTLTPMQKALIKEKSEYTLESKLDTYAKRFKSLGFIDEARKDQLVDIASRIPNNSLLIEYDSVVNQLLIFLEAGGAARNGPCYGILKRLAQEAYDRRQAARAVAAAPPGPAPAPPGPVVAPPGPAAVPARLTNLQLNTDDAVTNGHGMEVALVIDAGANPPQNFPTYTIYGAGIEYWESVEKDYEFEEADATKVEGRKENREGRSIKQWNDVYALHANSPTWTKTKTGGKSLGEAMREAQARTLTGTQTAKFYDVPAYSARLNRYGKRTTKFRIVGKDLHGTHREIHAVQVITLGGQAQATGRFYADSEGHRLTEGTAADVPHAVTPEVLESGIPKVDRLALSTLVRMIRANQAEHFENWELFGLSLALVREWDTMTEPEKYAAYTGMAKAGKDPGGAIAGLNCVPYPQPGLEYKQYRLGGSALLVAVVQGGRILKMYHTDGKFKDAMAWYFWPAKPHRKNIGEVKVRSYTEIPIEFVARL